VTTPLQGHFVIHKLELAIINTYTKFEVLMFKHHEHTKGDTKCRYWGGFEWSWVTQGHQQHNQSIKHIQLPIRL